MKELERTASLELQPVKMEDRLEEKEERTMRLERCMAFLLHEKGKLAAKCDDLEARDRHNNVSFWMIRRKMT